VPSCSVRWNSRVIAVTGTTRDCHRRDLDTPEGPAAPEDRRSFPVRRDNPGHRSIQGTGDLDERGAVVTRSYVETLQAGVFAAGDVTDNGFRQVVTAASDGTTAPGPPGRPSSTWRTGGRDAAAVQR
jgi:thioredoxin reductase